MIPTLPEFEPKINAEKALIAKYEAARKIAADLHQKAIKTMLLSDSTKWIEAEAKKDVLKRKILRIIMSKCSGSPLTLLHNYKTILKNEYRRYNIPHGIA